MKKQRKKTQPKVKRKAHAAEPQSTGPDRRAILQWAAIGVVGIGGGGFFAVNSVMASLAEQDLTKIGQGTPAIVQIHDPGCSLCQQLQRETRAALKSFGKDDLVYLVANVKSDPGAVFANAHGVSHVTLMLFDGAGRLQGTLQGVRQQEELTAAFTQLADAG